jgi:hypothetical protein
VDEKPLMEEALKNLDLSFRKPCLAIASRNATETQKWIPHCTGRTWVAKFFGIFLTYY